MISMLQKQFNDNNLMISPREFELFVITEFGMKCQRDKEEDQVYLKVTKSAISYPMFQYIMFNYFAEEIPTTVKCPDWSTEEEAWFYNDIEA